MRPAAALGHLKPAILVVVLIAANCSLQCRSQVRALQQLAGGVKGASGAPRRASPLANKFKLARQGEVKRAENERPQWKPQLVKQARVGEPLNYGVVVDCGSSGTRATIYAWPRGTPSGQLAQALKPLVDGAGQPLSVRLRPGLASLREQPNYASDYMRPIMEFAARHVPAELQAATPVYFMGTAGMRLLEPAERRAILDDLRVDLRRDFAFQNIQAEVISGLEEGLFQWVSVNALARRLTSQFGPAAAGARRAPQRRRLAVLEMGGASAQVAFEVDANLDALTWRRLKGQPGAWEAYARSRKSLNLNADSPRANVDVFAVSFLGFGSDTARSLAVDLLVRDSLKFATAGGQWPSELPANSTLSIQDPCLPRGARETLLKPLELVRAAGWSAKTIGYNLRPSSEGAIIRVKLEGRGHYPKCQFLLNRLALVARREQTTCKAAPEIAASGRASQACEAPLIGTQFVPWTEFQFVGLGELFYTQKEMFNSTGPLDGPALVRNTARLCASPWQAIQARYPAASEFERRRNLLACFKATWILAWLKQVLAGGPYLLANKALATPLDITDQVSGVEVDWKLGAILTRLAGSKHAFEDLGAD